MAGLDVAADGARLREAFWRLGGLEAERDCDAGAARRKGETRGNERVSGTTKESSTFAGADTPSTFSRFSG
jgi:hypothetical protein